MVLRTLVLYAYRSMDGRVRYDRRPRYLNDWCKPIMPKHTSLKPQIVKPVSKSIAASILFFFCTANEKEHQAIPTTITQKTIAVLGPNEDTYFDIHQRQGRIQIQSHRVRGSSTNHTAFPANGQVLRGRVPMLYFENPEQWLDFPNYRGPDTAQRTTVNPTRIGAG